MKNYSVKTKKIKKIPIVKPEENVTIISQDDIRKRAYEVYLGNDVSSSNELDNWLFAERELTGFYN